MQLLDSEQIEIADEYFRFRAINPPCAGDRVSVHSAGRTPCALCWGPQDAAVQPLLVLVHAPVQTRTCTRSPRAPRRVGAQRNTGLCPKPAETAGQFWRKSGGEAECSQGRELKWKGSRVQGSTSQWTRRKKGWRLLPVEIFNANKAKVSAQKNNSKPNSLVVRSYSWAHFIQKSRVIPFLCWDQAIKSQV